jgi:two-component system, LytTR family, sensor kinase
VQTIQKYLLQVLIPLAFVSLALHTYLLTEVAGFGLQLALTDSLPTTLLLVITVWPLTVVLNSYPTRVGIVLYAIIAAIIFSSITCFFTLVFLKWFGNEVPGYRDWVEDTALVRYIWFWVVSAWLGTASALDKRAKDIQQKIKQQSDAATLLKEAELYKLRQQLQPHFLYNSLNSISALTMIEPAKAQEMIGKLSEFLRSSVKREAQDKIPVAEELNYIEAYLTIESIRFGDRLNVLFDKDYTDDAQIPPFLLQPVLENAIKFGLYGRTGDVTIRVTIRWEPGMLTIIISNPYDAQGQIPRGTGFGLDSINRRLYLLFGRTDLLETQKTEDLFTTILKIPQVYV